MARVIFPSVQKRTYNVYMLQSTSRRALYAGMSSKLVKRVWDHKTGAFEGFTAQYNATRLVHVESYDKVHDAIAREKQIKGWTRAKKEALIRANPHWKDLSEGWFDEKRLKAAYEENLRRKQSAAHKEAKATATQKVLRAKGGRSG